jgi:ATP synthase I chain
MNPEQAFADDAVRRIERSTLVLAGAGCVVCLAVRGWSWGAGFLLGAAASFVNFRWLKRVVYALGGGVQGPLGGRFAIIIGLRYLLLAVGAYVISKLTPISLPAALAGLFVPVAAVIVEIVFELVYTR